MSTQPVTGHSIILWFLGAVAMLALADKAGKMAIALMLVIILLVLLRNWPVYKSYLGL